MSASEQPRIRRVGVVAKRSSTEAARVARELAEWLRRRKIEVALDEETLRNCGDEDRPVFHPEEPVDLAVVLGGDGTLLGVARRLEAGVPLLGVNLGSLGFLTEISRDELYKTMVQVLAGKYSLEARTLLQVDVCTVGGEVVTYRALNDLVIAKAARSRIISMGLTVDGQAVANYRADGLIVSTPTGSTAYNLSAAGPILHPLLPVTVLTPICPHTLSLRPMVVPDSAVIEITLGTDNEEVYLTTDGQEDMTLDFRDTVRVTRSRSKVQLVKASRRTFYDSLRGKLRWGGLSNDGVAEGGANPGEPSKSGEDMP